MYDIWLSERNILFNMFTTYVICLLSLFYTIPNTLNYNTVSDSFYNLMNKLLYIIILNNAFALHLINNNYELINIAISLSIMYCGLHCFYNDEIKYSTILYFTSHFIGTIILYNRNILLYESMQHTPYIIVYSIAYGTPYVNSIAIIIDYFTD